MFVHIKTLSVRRENKTADFVVAIAVDSSRGSTKDSIGKAGTVREAFLQALDSLETNFNNFQK